MSQLILTVTRRCNLRCNYCPTAKDGFPSLTPRDALRALAVFRDRFGGGDVKLFGGEPLLEPEVVRAVFEAARREPRIGRVYLSTNGLGLDSEWLAYLAGHDKAVLTLSLDGRPGDHRRLRRALPNVGDAYEHVLGLLPELLAMPRLVVTQTIAPSTAASADQNFAHLLGLGFRRFNFLPGYYLPWRDEQLRALRQGFEAIASRIAERWQQGRFTYVRNLFTWAPTPFFNTGVVVDSDGSIHPNNLGLASALDELLPRSRSGSLDDPPTLDELERKARDVDAWLQEKLPADVMRSTVAVDAELSRFCRGLYPEFAAYRRRRSAA
ncbi:MAG: radical SAM protein [Polyangiaceae bacterium]|nr:radical SAM protein [Polyangiaceae bacterium]